jgi:hypothetical protein
MGRVRQALGAALLLGLWLLGAAPALAADPAWGDPTISGRLGEAVTVRQPVTLDAIPSRVELLIATEEGAAPLVREVPPPPTTGPVTLEGELGGADGHLLPNTPISARWRITPADGGEPVLGPVASMVYRDERFDWRTVEGDIVRVHWYEGSQAFADRALAIGEEAVRETAALLGVTEDEPVDFFIYAEQDEFYDALGPGTRENVGGQANAGIRTLFALIGPSEIDDPWVGTVIPHELVHLVFDTAVDNPYHFPPRWLNEGLAVYLSEGYGPSDQAAVESAGRRGELIPLDGLAGQFPTTRDGFFLAYAESVSAVDFLVRTYDQDALVALIASYADGRTDDEAFEAALGVDVEGFGAAWLADLGVEPPTRYGPQPAPPGPRPPDWPVGGVDGPVVEPVPTDGGGGGPAPTGAGDPGAPAPEAGGTSAGSVGLLVAALLVVLVAVAVLVVRRRAGRDAGVTPPGPPPSGAA